MSGAVSRLPMNMRQEESPGNTGSDSDIGCRTPYGTQGQVYRHLRIARPLPGGRLLRFGDLWLRIVSRMATSGVDKWLTATATLCRILGMNRGRDITRLTAPLIFLIKVREGSVFPRVLFCLCQLKVLNSHCDFIALKIGHGKTKIPVGI